MAKQSSLDDVGLDMEGDEAEEDFEDASASATGATATAAGGDEPDSGNGSGNEEAASAAEPPRVDSPRPGTPIPEKGKLRIFISLSASILKNSLQSRKRCQEASRGRQRSDRRILTNSWTTQGRTLKKSQKINANIYVQILE